MPHKVLLMMGFLPLGSGHINDRPKNLTGNIEHVMLEARILLFYEV